MKGLIAIKLSHVLSSDNSTAIVYINVLTHSINGRMLYKIKSYQKLSSY